MTEFFSELFYYNHSCNQKLIDSFLNIDQGIADQSIRLLNHILNAHQIWNNRALSRHEFYGVWEIHHLSELKNIDVSNYQHSSDILAKVNLDTNVAYLTSTGTAFNNKLRDMLFHIINHSTYHRAQIATEFKENGLHPIASDYIHFKR
jgi:uncharacterized damage-inducible protein DinB